jgi:hypothetical protein
MMSRRLFCFLVLGAASGAVSALLTLWQLGGVVAPMLFRTCFGIKMSNSCEGIDASVYLFPGLIFGVFFAAAQRWRGLFDIGRAAALVLVSMIGNAVATFLCVGLFGVLSETMSISAEELPLALAGASAGAAGSAVVVFIVRFLATGNRSIRPILTGSALGLLTPLVTDFDFAGDLAFYVIWQGGFAAALALGEAQG